MNFDSTKKRFLIFIIFAVPLFLLAKGIIDYYLAHSSDIPATFFISGLGFAILFVLSIFLITGAIGKMPEALKKQDGDPVLGMESMNELIADLESARLTAERVKAKNETILFNIGDGLIVIDEFGQIDLVNKSYEDMTGYKADQLLGKHWDRAVDLKYESGRSIPKEESVIGKVFDYQKRFVTSPVITPSLRYYLGHISGRRIPVQITASPVKVGNRVTEVICIFRDISKEMEIEKSKTEFVAVASHQLRTPLSTVNWYTEMLLTGDVGKLTDKQTDYLKEIYRGNQRMIDLVNALLNVSRLEIGAFIVDPKMIDLRDVMKDVLNELEPEIREKGITLEETYSSRLPLVQADRSLARIIFQNLLSNAVKYSRGKVEISMRLQKGASLREMSDKDSEAVLIKIHDNGIGIPVSQQDQVFTKLFRADNARLRVQEGTGLGLYIVKSIIDQTGGRIWFESVENKETAFYIFVPIRWMEKKTGTRRLGAN